MMNNQCRDARTNASHSMHDMTKPPGRDDRPDLYEDAGAATDDYCTRCGWITRYLVDVHAKTNMARLDPDGSIARWTGKTSEGLMEAFQRSYGDALQDKSLHLHIRLQVEHTQGDEETSALCNCGADPEPCSHLLHVLNVIQDNELRAMAMDAAAAE